MEARNKVIEGLAMFSKGQKVLVEQDKNVRRTKRKETALTKDKTRVLAEVVSLLSSKVSCDMKHMVMGI